MHCLYPLARVITHSHSPCHSCLSLLLPLFPPLSPFPLCPSLQLLDAYASQLSRALTSLKEATAAPPAKAGAAAAGAAASQQIPPAVVSAVVAAAEAQQTALQELLEDRNLLLSRVEELDRVLSLLPLPGMNAQE